jgi:predicted deacetylase
VSAAPALLSIHDVMPETLPAVASLREEILRAGLRAPALLVVPGRSWKPEDLETLRQWALAGSELIGHGWLHHTCPRSLKHRLHALLLSRNVAEHLALSPGGISDLMQRCADWFTAQNLPRPSAYVPPAWALGMSPRALAGLPFEQVETLRGVHVLSAGRRGFMPMPLLGFEADTVLRAAVLRRWNTRQWDRARRLSQPLRIGLHPHDGTLLLADQLREFLSMDWHCLRYEDLGGPRVK